MVAEKNWANADAQHEESSALAFKCIWIFGVWNAVVLVALIATAMTGGTTSTFMWVRAVILLPVTPFLLWLNGRAGRGEVSAIGRLRAVSTILPIAIVVVDFIPGVAPSWYAVLQGVGALTLVPVAVITWRASRRGAAALRSGKR